MKVNKFVELPVTTWNGYIHEGVDALFNMDEVSKIEPQGKFIQTKIIFKNGTEEFISLKYDDVVKRLKA